MANQNTESRSAYYRNGPDEQEIQEAYFRLGIIPFGIGITLILFLVILPT